MAEPPATAATEPADPGVSRQTASMMAALAASHATTARRHAEQAQSDAEAALMVWRKLRRYMPIFSAAGAVVGYQLGDLLDRWLG